RRPTASDCNDIWRCSMAEAVLDAGQVMATQPAAATPAAAAESTATGISVRHLYKIFGPTPEKFLDAVREGMSKQELRDTHGHVLGLRDISIDMPSAGIQVVMGLSGSGKSTLIRHINRLIDPTAGEVIVQVGGHEVDVVERGAGVLGRVRRETTDMGLQEFRLL